MLFAQDLSVTGKITDASGTVLSGAVIKASGHKATTISGRDGTFAIKISSSVKSLRVTYVGAEEQVVVLTGQPLNIVMKTSISNLSEVVVVGYGTKLKKDVTGSVSSVSAK